MRSFIYVCAVVVLVCLVVSVGCTPEQEIVSEKTKSVSDAAGQPKTTPPSIDDFDAAIAEINTFAREHDLDILSDEEIEAARASLPPVRNILPATSMDLPTLTLKPGQTWSQKVKLLTQMILPMPMDLFNTESNLLLDSRVLAVDPDGSTIEVTIAGIDASASLMGRKYSFDHTIDADTPVTGTQKLSHARKYKNAFAGLVGTKYSARLDNGGNVVKLLDIDPRLQKIADNTVSQNQGTEQTTTLLSRGCLRDYAAINMFDAGQSNSLSKNSPWSTTATAKAPRVPETTTTRTHRVDSFEEVDGKKFANITYDLADVSTPKSEEPKPKSKRRKGRPSNNLNATGVRGIGEITYSFPDARIVSHAEKMRIDISPSLPSRNPAKKDVGKRKNKMYYKINRFIELIDDE